MDGTLYRLNQSIAKTGLCSRRDADQLIAAGRVTVNGQVVHSFNSLINPFTDVLTVDGKKLSIKKPLYVAMYKPSGIVTSCNDEKGRQSIVDLLPKDLKHLRPIGRLDMYSEGLIIFSNDGELTQRLTHPVHHIPKRYLITVTGYVSDQALQQMAKGMMLDDGPTQPAQTKLTARKTQSTTFELTIREGRNRQIRRMCKQIGHCVRRLVRVSIGGLQLGQMAPGDWRYLSPAEIAQLECS